jgi:hypothetical protein
LVHPWLKNRLTGTLGAKTTPKIAPNQQETGKSLGNHKEVPMPVFLFMSKLDICLSIIFFKGNMHKKAVLYKLPQFL